MRAGDSGRRAAPSTIDKWDGVHVVLARTMVDATIVAPSRGAVVLPASRMAFEFGLLGNEQRCPAGGRPSKLPIRRRTTPYFC
jgi:hypothetical protein